MLNFHSFLRRSMPGPMAFNVVNARTYKKAQPNHLDRAL